MTVGELRRRLNLTQEAFAHLVGVTVGTVNRWERGVVNPSRLARRVLEQMEHESALQGSEGVQGSEGGDT